MTKSPSDDPKQDFSVFTATIGKLNGQNAVCVISGITEKTNYHWFSAAGARDFANSLKSLADAIDPPQPASKQQQLTRGL